MEMDVSDSSEVPKDEDKRNETLRMSAALAFSFVLLVIGIPLWWKMTEVKRHPLPSSRILALNDIDAKVAINISILSNNSYTSSDIINKLKERFSQSDLFHVYLEELPFKMDFANLDLSSFEKLEEIHPSKVGSLLLVEIQNFPEIENNVLLGMHRTIYFKPGTAVEEIFNVLNSVLQEEEMFDSMKAMVEPGYVSKSISSKRRVRTSVDYDIIFSIVNPHPESVILKWDLPRVLKENIAPLLDQIKKLAGFHLKSQWLYFIDFDQIPKKIASDDGSHNFILTDKQLPHIISPLEKKLGSGVSKSPCIHFVLYATPCESHPLYFQSKDGKKTTTILSARWGGIHLLNANSTTCPPTEAFIPRDEEVMAVAFTLFRTLLGLQEFSEAVYVQKQHGIKLSLWELDYLYRLRSLEQFASARLTLNSLARLLTRISNIVITEEVGKAVFDSVTAAEKVLEAYKKGNLDDALKYSKEAFSQAEFAFTHPSLLALLYFPDDQKYAVYIPLFLPIMIPVLLSMKSIRPWLKGKLLQKKDGNIKAEKLEEEKKTD